MNFKKVVAGLSIIATLSMSACSTTNSRACQIGQGVNGMTPAQTCQAASVEQQQQTNGVLAGIGAVLLTGLAAIAVVSALYPERNYYTTYVY